LVETWDYGNGNMTFDDGNGNLKPRFMDSDKDLIGLAWE